MKYRNKKSFFTLAELIIVMVMISAIAGFASLFIGETIFKFVVAEQSAEVTQKVKFAMQRIIKELREEGAYQGVFRSGRRLSFLKNVNSTGTDYIQYDKDLGELRLYKKNGSGAGYLLLDGVIAGDGAVNFTLLSSGAVKIQINTTVNAGQRSSETVNNATFESIYFPR